jgi:hypothetical protein
VTPLHLQLARAVWRAFTGSDPVAVEKILITDTSAPPFLAGALRRLLEEFPSTRNGLARSEEQALRAASESAGASTGRMFVAFQAMEESTFMGDVSFWHLLMRLAAEPHPLLSLSADTTEGFGQRVVKIDSLGRQVLRGDVDYVRLGVANKWIGGVHLQGSESRWRWNGSGLVKLSI